MANGSVASAFGAKVTLSAPELGLYLVMGRVPAAASDITMAGGTLIFAIPDSLSFLALMSASSFLSLRRNPTIALIGLSACLTVGCGGRSPVSQLRDGTPAEAAAPPGEPGQPELAGSGSAG